VDRGDVKFLIMTVLQDGPKHGYEIIKEIEKRSQGAYAPSAGTIYPTLQMLEDMGHVRSRQQEERRIYEITDEGRAYLAENQVAAGEAWGRFEGWDWRELFGSEEHRQLQREMFELARALFAGGRIFRADAKTLQEVREALQKARERIDSALGD
jgi:DNA-binding PadR family transcriptional regulator